MIDATDRIRLVQVFVDGHGVNHPVVSNSPPADKALNRPSRSSSIRKAINSALRSIGVPMTSEETLRRSLLTVVVNENFSEAVMQLRDNSRLCFCHRVGERWAKAVGPEEREHEGGKAGELLSAITMFRLNRKHLDIQFEDGSRWDEALQDFNHGDDHR